MHPTASNMQASGCMFYACSIGLYMHVACMFHVTCMVHGACMLAGPVVCMLSACLPACMLQAYNMHSTCIMHNAISDMHIPCK